MRGLIDQLGSLFLREHSTRHEGVCVRSCDKWVNELDIMLSRNEFSRKQGGGQWNKRQDWVNKNRQCCEVF